MLYGEKCKATKNKQTNKTSQRRIWEVNTVVETSMQTSMDLKSHTKILTFCMNELHCFMQMYEWGEYIFLFLQCKVVASEHIWACACHYRLHTYFLLCSSLTTVREAPTWVPKVDHCDVLEALTVPFSWQTAWHLDPGSADIAFYGIHIHSLCVMFSVPPAATQPQSRTFTPQCMTVAWELE